MPLVRRYYAIKDLPKRFGRVWLVLQHPVRRFLEQRGDEAMACFHSIFNAFAEFPLLGLSAIAGLVGLFAYVKALLELHGDQLYAGSLITAGDVTDFAVRLGVPFVLLMCAIAALIAGLIAILALNHRNRPKKYWLFTIAALVIFGLCLALYAFWIDVSLWEEAWLITVFVAGTVTLGYLAGRLYRMGRTPGIANQERFQRSLLDVLQVIANPGGLLMLLGAVGLYLALSQTSVLFDRALSALDLRTTATLCPEELSFLETKFFDRPLVIRKRMARLGSLWVLQSSTAMSKGPMKSCNRGTVAQEPTVEVKQLTWVYLRSEDLSCVRPFDMAEWESKAGATRHCATLKPVEPPPNPQARAPGSIADYAKLFLDCDPDTLGVGVGVGHAFVFHFPLGEPKDSAAIRHWLRQSHNASIHIVPTSELGKHGLEGVRSVGEGEIDLTNFQRDTSDPTRKFWILGFASVVGHSTKNQDLSENRARAVAGLINPQGSQSHARGLGAALMSGTASPAEDDSEQIAVAFECRNRVI